MNENIKKPLIGVVPLWDEKRDSLWMLPGYMDGIERAGGMPVMLPLSVDAPVIEQISRTVDGLLFTGGHDISPALYGEEKSEYCDELCEKRDEMETALFKSAVMGCDKPALGICRGIQLINALLGGTLYQDLGVQYKAGRLVNHRETPPPGETPVHTVSIKSGSPLHSLLKTDSIAVNSCHHQGIKELSSELECMAASEDNLAEAVYMPGRKYVWAVQWHPECMNDENSRMLFLSFINAC